MFAMEEKELIIKLRKYIAKYGLRELDDKKLESVGINPNDMKNFFNDREEIATKVLLYERSKFEEIFNEYCFEGWNAIDIFLIVSNEIDKHFFEVSPSYTINLASDFPEVFEQHMRLRSDFIYDKIKINIEKGMEQGMYIKDVSSEMIARMYISKLNDIHNPDIYPAEGFTFSTIFSNLIDNVIKSITNDEGKMYYKQRKQLYSILNFR
ncbi:MAG: hypothetical protein ACRDDZ_13765 [Marinifilaceae bacterium]